MKAIKIILGIILVLTIAFFSAGLVFKENEYSIDITIEKPLDKVFDQFHDIDFLKKWKPEIISVDTTYYNPQFTGSQFALMVNNNGEEIKMSQKILAFIPNEKITFYYDAENMLKTDQFLFSSNGSATNLTLKSSFKSEDSYLLSCVFPFLKETLKDIDLQYLENFKNLIEK